MKQLEVEDKEQKVKFKIVNTTEIEGKIAKKFLAHL